MDYEKKYNEAMLRADEAVQKGCLDKDMFDNIFPPEESEDERIRKCIGMALTDVDEQRFKDFGTTLKDCLAYLEKQKEQKPMDKHLAVYLAAVIARDIDRVMDGMCISNTECVALENAFLNGEYDKISDFLEKKYTANKQEQKPAEWSEYKDKIDIPYCSSEPEWSEEDEKMRDSILAELANHICYNKPLDGMPSGTGWTSYKYQQEMDWLTNRFKSLRSQPREEIYQSAKHDIAIKFMNYLDKNRPEGKMSLSNVECEDIDKAFKENDWAKIVRYYEKYRPHWKPTVEKSV